MNREIKFRGKANDGKWYFGDLICGHRKLQNSHYYIREQNDFTCQKDYYVAVIPETVGQFTGIKYENKDDYMCVGDLFYTNGWETSIEECMYFEQYGVIGCYAHWKTADKIGFFSHFIRIPSVKFYHVGNIHDNPELLTQK